MATYAELQADVLRNVIDAPAHVVAAVPKAVNEAIRKIQNKHDFKVMEEELEAEVTAPATRTLVVAPADFKKFRETDVPYIVRNIGSVRELEIATNLRQLRRSFEPAETGEPRALYYDGTNFQVWPLSDSLSDWGDGEYRVYVPYYKFLPDLTSAGSSNWFTLNAPRWVEYQATADAFALDWNEERQVIWTQRAAAEFAEAVSLDKRQRVAGLQTLIPHLGGRARLLRRH